MTKLVISDLDGTLLLPGGSLPGGVFGAVRALSEKGITFVPASGRQLPSLTEMFEPVLSNVILIAENGGLVTENGVTVYSSPMKAGAASEALMALKGYGTLHPLLSCLNAAYFEEGGQAFAEKVTGSYTASERVRDLQGAADGETVYKISVWDSERRADEKAQILSEKLGGFSVTASGPDWLDISDPSVNKGAALEFIMERRGVKPSECVAFGDHMNDLEMLLMCGRAYVTEDCYPELKKYIKDTVPPAGRLGVLSKIGELI